ncbi:hypothetical protein BHM03_00015957 [Ensete ventricosum]|nr:hypothetical protein BHM03_00015957 [Ensete ventricosum]
MCASSPAVVSERSWSSIEWVEPRGAFIVSTIGHSYLISLLPLLLIIPSYLSTTPTVLAVRRAPAAGLGNDPIEHELIRLSRSSGIDPIERGSGKGLVGFEYLEAGLAEQSISKAGLVE